MPLKLVIIGAGLAGLSAAIAVKLSNPKTDVLLLESVKSLETAGAGVQLTPNATKLFRLWGIYEAVASKATAAVTSIIRRYDGSRILSRSSEFQSALLGTYDAPLWGVHRGDLQQVLVRRSEELGVRLRLSAEVVDADFDAPSVTLQDGEIVGCDVILCADGIWSLMRSKFLGRTCPPVLSGQLGYRLLFRRDAIKDPELKQWVEMRMLNYWYGPGRHVVCYNMRGSELMGMGFVAPDNDVLPANVKFQRGEAAELKAVFQGWDPILHRLIDEAEAISKWKLYRLDALPEWKTENGKFVMAGDCCHPMLPYLAQGANSSLEDGAVFGHLLGKVKDASQLPAMARMYQQVRKGRGDTIMDEALRQRDILHIPDGPEQKRRDADYAQDKLPIPWPPLRVQSWLYGYNAYEEAEGTYEQNPF